MNKARQQRANHAARKRGARKLQQQQYQRGRNQQRKRPSLRQGIGGGPLMAHAVGMALGQSIFDLETLPLDLHEDKLHRLAEMFDRPYYREYRNVR